MAFESIGTGTCSLLVGTNVSTSLLLRTQHDFDSARAPGGNLHTRGKLPCWPAYKTLFVVVD